MVMASQASAGDFEIKFSETLTNRLLAGERLSIELVRDCYRQAGDALGLPVSKADELHLADIFDALSNYSTPLVALGKAKLSKVIFDVIYMH